MADSIEEGPGELDSDAEVQISLSSYRAPVRLVSDPAEEILLLWATQRPTLSRPNSFVRHSSLRLDIDACGRRHTIFQSPSFMSTPGVTGAVIWDSGVVLGKFLEHAVDAGMLILQGRKAIELGAGCGLVGCIAALLGAQVILTDLPDRMKLLKKNVEANIREGNERGTATMSELEWGDDPDSELTESLPDLILGSDIIYSEGAVTDLLITLRKLSGNHTTIFLAGELRNDAVLEYFLEAALQEFVIGRIEQVQWHPDYGSHRVAMFILRKKL